MTNEEMAIAIYKGQKTLLKDLYLNNRGIIYNHAKSFYNRNSERCKRCGIEIDDMINEVYFILPDIVKAYNQSNKPYKFVTFLKYPLITCFSELAGIRTKTQRKEPLNLSHSLDALISETEGITFGDTIEDTNAIKIFEKTDKCDYFNTLYEEINNLSEKEQKTIKRHYLNNESLTSIAKSEGVTINAIREHKVKAIRKLRKNEKIQNCYQVDYGVIAYRHVGFKEFSRTWTSSTEWAALVAMGEINNERSDEFE